MDLTLIREAFESDTTPIIRTDFTNNSAWQTVTLEVSKPVDFDNPDSPDPGDDGYAANVTLIEDPALEGITGAALGQAFETSAEAFGYALLADGRSMAEAIAGGEITLDYVDLSISDPEDAELFNSFMGRTFRCVIPEVASIEANLSIANMDFSDFADNTDADGVFRGFEDHR